MSLPKPTITDRAIATVSPERAVKRVRARAALSAYSSLVGGTGGYRGASSLTRTLRNWITGARSADADTAPDLETLRSRSRDLLRNAPIATGAISTVVTSVVGTGLQLTAAIDREILGIDEDAAQAWERRAELIWRLWCRQADITRQQHFSEMQGLALRSQLESGDLFVVRRFRQRKGDLLALKLQLVEADRIATPPEKSADLLICDGVVRDDDGAPTGYWVRNRYPDDPRHVGDRYELLEAYGKTTGERMVIHLFDRTRPGLSRGIPYLAPVIEALKGLERYTEAEIAAAVIAAFFTVFVKSEAAEGLADQRAVIPEDDGTVEGAARDLELGPAAILDLMPGEDIVTANPGRPNAAFDPFVTAVMTQIGMALELPFEVLAKHFKASYSAARGAILEAWRFFRRRRHFLGLGLCDPVYEWVITESVSRGLLPAPGYFRDPLVRSAWLGTHWTGPSAGQIDSTKEVKAIQQLREEGWISDSEAVQELRGRDFETVAQQQARDNRTRERLGIPRMAASTAEPADAEAPPQDVPDQEDQA